MLTSPQRHKLLRYCQLIISEPEQRGTDKVWLSTFRYSCKDCHSMDMSSIGIGRLLAHTLGLKLMRSLRFSLDGSNMAGRRGRALRYPIEAVILAAWLGVSLSCLGQGST